MIRPLIIGNWKMNNILAESEVLVRHLCMALTGDAAVEVVVCPPFTALAAVAQILPPHIVLGAQNLHPAPGGAYTGEISAAMLTELKCRYVLIGHSERRQHLGETDSFVAEKVRAVVGSGMVPVLCVGESMSERESGIGEAVVGTQISVGLSRLAATVEAPIVIAYEPVWAIGSGQAASPGQAAAMLTYIKDMVAAILPRADSRFLYGGSVTPANMAEFAACAVIDGALVGGASLKADQFAALVGITGENKNI